MAGATTWSVREVVRRLLFAIVTLGLTWLWCATAAAACGGWRELLASPARRGGVLVAFGLTLVTPFTPFNMSPGKRRDLGDLWIVVPAIVVTILVAWLPA